MDLIPILVVGGIAVAVCAGVVADARGRSFFGWTLFALVLTPLVAFIMLALLPKLENVTVVPHQPRGQGEQASRREVIMITAIAAVIAVAMLGAALVDLLPIYP